MIVDVLRRNWARLSRPRVLHDRRAVGMMSISFDDFPKTAWTEGGRVLRDHGLLATYYVSGGLCSTVFDGEQMYDATDLEPIHAEGHEIGCHTFDHRSCLRMSSAEFERTMRDNQAFVNKHLGDVRFASFAFPYGHTSASAKRIAVRRFSSARGVDQSVNVGRIDLGQLKAVGLETGKRRLEDVERYIARAAAERAWLIVYTHDVQDRPSTYGCRPEQLDRLLRTAKAAGLEILPVKAALAARAFAT
jgi:peptidoglycan/xylan/chitin deacetylase (PgdA/CDA1 family)